VADLKENAEKMLEAEKKDIKKHTKRWETKNGGK
jgi:hypothetical protein